MRPPNLIAGGPFKVRASSWGLLFNCSHAWEGRYLMGLDKPAGLRAHLGTSLHAATAAFDLARIEGYEISADDAAEVFIDAIDNPDRDIDLKQDDLKLRDAKRIGLILLSRYCYEIAPQMHYEAVELETVPFVIDCGGGVQIQLTGTLDRSRLNVENGKRGIKDLKSGATAVVDGVAKTKGHRAQIGVYELLYEHSTGIRIEDDGEIIGLKTSGNPEVAAGGFIRNAREMMVGTDEHPGLIQFAASMFQSGLFPPNPQSHLCSAKYCSRWAICRYHE